MEESQAHRYPDCNSNRILPCRKSAILTRVRIHWCDEWVRSRHSLFDKKSIAEIVNL